MSVDEAHVRRELYQMWRINWYWPIRMRDAVVCPKCRTRILPDVGRPDILIINPVGRTRVCEVKVVSIDRRNSFTFDQVTDEQHKWLDNYLADNGLGYLAIGTVGERPRSLWLIDWGLWTQIETRTKEEYDVGFIPVYRDGITRIAMREDEWSIENLCSHCRLTRSSGLWHLPRGHSGKNDGLPKKYGERVVYKNQKVK